jgi:hypothetical protein
MVPEVAALRVAGRRDREMGEHPDAFKQRSTHRRWLVVAIVAGAMLSNGLLPSLAFAATSPTTWHRLNVHADPPEHERFMCLSSADEWTCRYDKLPGRELSWDQTRGTFSGEDTTADWTCPGWFPADACDAADTVVTGVASFTFPRASGGFSVDQQLLVGDDGRLWIYWVDQFVCPWYPTFSDALVSEGSCTFI